MNIIKSIRKYGKNPYALFDRFSNGERFRTMDDKKYLELKFRGRLGYPLNLANPQTYNEKIQWFKMYDRRPIYNTMVDKADAKDYVAEIIGDEYIIPTLGIWDKFEDIDFEALPSKFVLKCTHDSGGLVVCKDKSKLDIEAAKKKIDVCLERNFFYYGREWAYKDVRPRIIAEVYLQDDHKDNGDEVLTDYKFMCINGIARNVMVCTGRSAGQIRYFFFDREWNFLRYNYGDEFLPKDFTMRKPEHLDEMWCIAEKLAKDIPFARIDLYEANRKVWFGEITLYPDSGFDVVISHDTDVLLGKMMVLPSE